jgi:hypothetical protein
MTDPGPIDVTHHAWIRWCERYPGQNLFATYARAKPLTSGYRRRIRERFPELYAKWFGSGWNGRNLRMTGEGVVFVCSLRKGHVDLLITVFPMMPKSGAGTVID